MFKKIGDATEIRVREYSTVQQFINPSIIDNFKKQAQDMKRIAPKANDFLYFSTVMMHAAEAATINDDGSPKLIDGKPVTASWDTSSGSYIWKCSDKNILPYRNQRGDIFPEAELIKAHKEWVTKPLCIDHKSDSVDHTRGFIVDTFYDYDLKRVVALCALDKHLYPDLAHKVSTGASNCVSMGTGVGRAVCTEEHCHRVASKASEFCDHMKYKTGYGEINLDLQPIELSIVVAGADKKATIKHIIASVNTLNEYVKSKGNLVKSGSKDLDFTSQLLSDMQKLIDKAVAELDSIKSEDSHESYEENSTESDIEYTDEPTDPGGAFPASARLASLDEKLTSMVKKVANLELTDLNKRLDNLSIKIANEDEWFSASITSATNGTDNISNHDKSFSIRTKDLSKLKDFLESSMEDLEEIKDDASKLEADDLDDDKKETFASLMDYTRNAVNLLTTKYDYLIKGQNMGINKKEAYFLGGGGVNEPTPGKQKYTPDPMNEDLRQKDHQMQGKKPFPEVGDVEGLYGDDLEFKKKILRASEEAKTQKREAIFAAAKDLVAKKEAYFLGGGGVNEPTPGKQKYTPDPMNEALRQKDHHMQGKKPFPEVGDVEGLYGDDLEFKKKILRASKVRASLVKSANAQVGDYTWKVFDGEGTVVFASQVKKLANNDPLLFSTVASKDYGTGLMKRVQNALLSKEAQELPAAPAPVPAAPTPAPAAAPAPAPAPAELPPGMPEMPVEEGAEEEKGSTDTSESLTDQAVDLSSQVRDLSSDLVEVVQELTGQQEKAGEVSPKLSSSPAFKLSREANLVLTDAISDQISDLQARLDELNSVAAMSAKKLSKTASADAKELFVQIADAAFDSAKESLAQGKVLMGSFLKYARGHQQLMKQAQVSEELEDSELDEDFEDDSTSDSLSDILDRVDQEISKSSGDSEDEDGDSLMADDEWDIEMDSDDHNLDMDCADDEYEDFGGLDLDEDAPLFDEELEGEDSLLADMVEVTTPDGKKVTAPAGSEVKTASRMEMRAKIAAKAMALSGVAGELSPSTKVEGISSDEAVSENIVDQQKKTMDLVLGKVKVRKEASHLHELVSKGEISHGDVDGLVAHGVDPEVVKYYKEMYSESDSEAKEFAAALSAENKKAEASAEIQTHKIKVSRAYDLVNEMVAKGLIDNDRDVISARVDELAFGSDDAFTQLKRVVASVEAPVQNIPVRGVMPQVGLVREASAIESKQTDMVSKYVQALQGARSPRTSR